MFSYLPSVLSLFWTISSFRGKDYVFWEKNQWQEGREDEEKKGRPVWIINTSLTLRNFYVLVENALYFFNSLPSSSQYHCIPKTPHALTTIFMEK